MRERILSYLHERLDSRRYEHVLGVEAMACRLAEHYGMDVEQARTAALLHDAAKCHTPEDYLLEGERHNVPMDAIFRSAPKLLHAPLAAQIAKQEFGVADEDILNAIEYHTTLRPGASKLEKLIYLADMVEETRDFHGVDELRALAFKDFDRAVMLSLRDCIGHVLDQCSLLHPHSVNAYNEMVAEISGIQL